MADKRLAEFTVPGHHNALAELLTGIPGLSKDSPILDIGCGTGAWLARLAGMGFSNLCGIDKDCGKFGTDKARCIQADIDWDEDIGLENMQFDLITAIEVIEHLENPGRLFHHMSRHLHDDGHILLTTPNIHSLIARIRFLLLGKMKQFDDKGDIGHISPILLHSLNKILPRHRLEIVNIWPYPLDGGSITTRKSLKYGAALMRLFMRDRIPGDHMCILISRSRNSNSGSQ